MGTSESIITTADTELTQAGDKLSIS